MRRQEKGFTLIELLVAVAIFTTIAVVLYSCFRGGVISWRRIESERSYQQKIRRLSSAITRDIRNMVYLSIIPFEGSQDSVSFVTCSNISKKNRPNIVKVSYFLMSKDEDVSSSFLARGEKELMDAISLLEPEPEEEGEEDLVAASNRQQEGDELIDGVREFRLSYLVPQEEAMEEESSPAEYEWTEFWEEEDILPKAIKFDITFIDPESKKETSFSKRLWIPAAADAEDQTDSGAGLSEGVADEIPEELPGE